jgi:hypothetical protein
MRIGERFFDDSFVAHLFGLTARQNRYLTERAGHGLRLRLMHIEIWSHVCLSRLPKADMLRKLREHVTIAA